VADLTLIAEVAALIKVNSLISTLGANLLRRSVAVCSCCTQFKCKLSQLPVVAFSVFVHCSHFAENYFVALLCSV